MSNAKFKVGEVLVCTRSASPGYTKGQTYKVYKNEKGAKCLMGDDGFEDTLDMLVSAFQVRRLVDS